MADTDVDFKEMTGDGLDADDVASIVEIDEDEVETPLIDDDTPIGLNGRPKDAGEEQEPVDDDYSEIEQILMEANGWEDR
jgi:hypothetical protein